MDSFFFLKFIFFYDLSVVYDYSMMIGGGRMGLVIHDRNFTTDKKNITTLIFYTYLIAETSVIQIKN